MLVAASGAFGLLVLYFCFRLGDDHILLKILLIFFFLASATVLSKAANDPNCSYILNTTSTNTTTNITTYNYAPLCLPPQSTTGTTFIKITTWLWRTFVAYILLYFIYITWVRKIAVSLGIKT